jgi:hypothetical protein
MKQDVEINYQCADVTYSEEITRKLTAKTISNNLPALPLQLYLEISAWLSHLSVKNNVEGVCSLTVVDDQWVPIIWHQEASGPLHVKYDESSDENIQLVKDLGATEALKTLHCTIHSHNRSAAGQSSDDQNDERSKNGWHMTIGNCDKSHHSIHSRFNVFKNADFVDGKKVSDAHQEFVLVDANVIVEEFINNSDIPDYCIKTTDEIIESKSLVKFNEEWLDRCSVIQTHHHSTQQMWSNNSKWNKKKHQQHPIFR